MPAAGTYVVDDHPVRMVADADGSLAAHALDLRSGALTRDDRWLPSIADGDPQVEPVPLDRFTRLVVALRRAIARGPGTAV